MEKSQQPASVAETIRVRRSTNGEVGRYIWLLEEQGLHLAFASAAVLHEHYTVLANDRPVAIIQLYAGHAPPGTIGVASSMFDLTDKGRGYFTRGYRELDLNDEMLHPIMGRVHLGQFQRIESSAAVDNVAGRRALEKLGFKLEGIQRNWYPTPSGQKDCAMYSFIPGVD